MVPRNRDPRCLEMRAPIAIVALTFSDALFAWGALGKSPDDRVSDICCMLRPMHNRMGLKTELCNTRRMRALHVTQQPTLRFIFSLGRYTIKIGLQIIICNTPRIAAHTLGKSSVEETR